MARTRRVNFFLKCRIFSYLFNRYPMDETIHVVLIVEAKHDNTVIVGNDLIVVRWWWLD